MATIADLIAMMAQQRPSIGPPNVAISTVPQGAPQIPMPMQGATQIPASMQGTPPPNTGGSTLPGLRGMKQGAMGGAAQGFADTGMGGIMGGAQAGAMNTPMGEILGSAAKAIK